jgi:hypothetical protein
MADASIDFHTQAIDYLKIHTPYSSLQVAPAYIDLAQKKLYSVETNVPLVRTICELQPTLTTRNRTNTFSFANIDRFKPHRQPYEFQTGQMEDVDIFKDIQRNLAKRNITFTPGDTLVDALTGMDHFSAPVDLPAHLDGSIGLLLLRRARNVRNDPALKAEDPFHVMTCIFDARWVQGRSLQQYDSFTNMHQPHGVGKDVTSNLVETKLGLAYLPDEGLIDSNLAVLPSIDRGRIRIHPDWFEPSPPS